MAVTLDSQKSELFACTRLILPFCHPAILPNGKSKVMVAENAAVAFLVLEAGAADELAHDGGGRYLLVGDGQEEVDELQQAVGLGVLRAVPGH